MVRASRLEAGKAAPPFTASTWNGGTAVVPDPAGAPVVLVLTRGFL